MVSNMIALADLRNLIRLGFRRDARPNGIGDDSSHQVLDGREAGFNPAPIHACSRIWLWSWPDKSGSNTAFGILIGRKIDHEGRMNFDETYFKIEGAMKAMSSMENCRYGEKRIEGEISNPQSERGPKEARSKTLQLTAIHITTAFLFDRLKHSFSVLMFLGRFAEEMEEAWNEMICRKKLSCDVVRLQRVIYSNITPNGKSLIILGVWKNRKLHNIDISSSPLPSIQ